MTQKSSRTSMLSVLALQLFFGTVPHPSEPIKPNALKNTLYTSQGLLRCCCDFDLFPEPWLIKSTRHYIGESKTVLIAAVPFCIVECGLLLLGVLVQLPARCCYPYCCCCCCPVVPMALLNTLSPLLMVPLSSSTPMIVSSVTSS